MSLALSYCREIADQLEQIAVYLPGEDVNAGDVIEFQNGKPIGSFSKRTDLFEMGLMISKEETQTKRSYLYATKGGVSTKFEMQGGVGKVGGGKLSVNYTKEGSIFLSAIDCKQERLKNIAGLEDLLASLQEKLDWNKYYIVSEVLRASKAFVMQSSNSAASVVFKGDVKGLQPQIGNFLQENGELHAGLKFQTTTYENASFIKDWSDDVAVFMKLVRYKSNWFGNYQLKGGIESTSGQGEHQFAIAEVDPKEVL